MNLRDFKNSSEFERFCKLLFKAEWDSFQSPAKYHDYGIDGYIPGEKIFACYFPEKSNPQEKDYKSKIKEDLKRLDNSIKKLGVKAKEWIFVTPEALPTEIISFIREESSKTGLSGYLYSSNDLTKLLLGHPKIKTQFPDLVLPDVAQQIEETNKKLDSVLEQISKPKKELIEEKVEGKQPELAFDTSSYLVADESTDDKNINLALKEWFKGNMKLALKHSEEAYYKTKGSTKLQSIVNIILTSKDNLSKRDYLIALCDEGIDLANRLGYISTGAVIKAHKARLINQRLLENSIKAYAEIQYRRVGYNAMLDAQLVALVKSLKPDGDSVQALAKESQEDAIKAKDYSAVVHIKMTLASTMGSLHPLIAHLGGNTGEIEHFVKRMYLEAKELYEYLGDKEGVAYTLHNLANNLRFFGEKDRALEFAKQAEKIAHETGNKFQEDKSKELISRLN